MVASAFRHFQDHSQSKALENRFPGSFQRRFLVTPKQNWTKD